ncbi:MULTISPECIES: flagellin N-terminal helical domain-containing protein [unclassified Curtobacterium]|uniref:flagellin N-terminal helical domain-containing protein n=1 Tax=unclassified Curtobacterium TaxID=257496 RepID=UPI00052AC6C8|nr:MULTISPECIES: flagellin [unclassified Curtobacterium]AIV40076.1 flagellin [Curtobacterium sp. MR_MD2014]MDB6426840.1 flagellin [Curtobacterium sp. 20TX0008]
MGMSINTNLSALNTYRNLNATQNDLSKSLEKLSTGLRINRAADDAAGLTISEGLKSQVGGLTVAARNAQDGISVVQTAEGGLTETHSILQRMRDLAVQAGNDSNNPTSREAIKTEVGQLQQELSRISDSTNFNGIKLLDGKAGTAGDGKLTFQVGANGDASSKITVDLAGANISKLATTLKDGTTTQAFEFDDKSFDATAPTAPTELKLSSDKGSAVDVTVDDATDAADYVTKLNTKLADSGFTATATTDAAGKTTGFTLTAADGGKVTAEDVTLKDVTSGALKFGSNAEAQDSIKALDVAIASVSSARSELGAVQNRFDHAINVTNVAKENLTAAGSRITDVDMAQEMVKYTRDNILSQAGTSMLAQANQSTQGVLSLLR